MNTTLLCQRPAACLVQLAQRSQENGEGVSSGRCEVNTGSICQFVQECVCICTECESVCGCCCV